MGKAILDPKRDLKGATPEKLARALLRRDGRSRARGQSVVGNKVPVEKVAADKASDRIAHLRKRS